MKGLGRSAAGGMKLGSDELAPVAREEMPPPTTSRVGPTAPAPAPAPAPAAAAAAAAPGAVPVSAPTKTTKSKHQQVFKRGDTGITLTLPGGNGNF